MPDVGLLSVLDQSPVPAGSTPADALANTLDLARLADRLGFTRYWLAEHHATEALAGSSPEVLTASVAAATRHIRVGSGGVMLPHYSPLKVAESFQVLHALHPGRVDLGVGRAPGGSPLVTIALDRHHRPPGADDFSRQIAELIGFLSGAFSVDHPFSRIRSSPRHEGGPDLWLLGSSPFSADLAARLGLRFCIAHFINPTDTEVMAERYHAAFEPTDAVAVPTLAVAVAAVCADHDEEAARLAASVTVWRDRLARPGGPGPIPTVDDALGALGPTGTEALARSRNRLAAGSPATVRARLMQLAADHGAAELIVVTITHDHAARRRSYELLARAFGLESRAAGEAA